MRSQNHRSSTKNEQPVSTIKETNISTVDRSSSTTDLHNNTMKNPSIQEIKNDVEPSQLSHPKTEKHLIESTNQVVTSPASSLIEQQRVIYKKLY